MLSNIVVQLFLNKQVSLTYNTLHCVDTIFYNLGCIYPTLRLSAHQEAVLYVHSTCHSQSCVRLSPDSSSAPPDTTLYWPSPRGEQAGWAGLPPGRPRPPSEHRMALSPPSICCREKRAIGREEDTVQMASNQVQTHIRTGRKPTNSPPANARLIHFSLP